MGRAAHILVVELVQLFDSGCDAVDLLGHEVCKRRLLRRGAALARNGISGAEEEDAVAHDQEQNTHAQPVRHELGEGLGKVANLAVDALGVHEPTVFGRHQEAPNT